MYEYIVTCQAHPVLVIKGESSVWFILLKGSLAPCLVAARAIVGDPTSLARTNILAHKLDRVLLHPHPLVLSTFGTSHLEVFNRSHMMSKCPRRPVLGMCSNTLFSCQTI